MEEKKLPVGVRVFEKVAENYDFVSKVISLGLIEKWQKRFISLISPKGKVLDIACGTGIFESWLLDKVPLIVGLDYSLSMLLTAKKKVKDGIFVRGDGLRLPFKSEVFDTVLVSFSLRHFDDVRIGVKEIGRVLKKGGTAGILELSLPERGVLRKSFEIFVKGFAVPFAKLRSKEDVLHHLWRSVEEFPKREEFKKLALESGFREVKVFNLFGEFVLVYKLLR